MGVTVTLDEFDIDELVDYLKEEGYTVIEEDCDVSRVICDDGYNGPAKFVCKYINDNGGDSLLKEILYEYLCMGHFNDVDALCKELKKRLK